jgi:hypothetical protein
VTQCLKTLSGYALKRTPASVCVAAHAIGPTSRDMLVAPFIAALSLALLDATACAGQIDLAETAHRSLPKRRRSRAFRAVPGCRLSRCPIS